MDENVLQELNKLKSEVVCEKNYICIDLSFKDLCNAKFYSNFNRIECFDESTTSCVNHKPFGIKNICTCPLRKFIAINQKKIYFSDANSNQNGN